MLDNSNIKECKVRRKSYQELLGIYQGYISLIKVITQLTPNQKAILRNSPTSKVKRQYKREIRY